MAPTKRRNSSKPPLPKMAFVTGSLKGIQIDRDPAQAEDSDDAYLRRLTQSVVSKGLRLTQPTVGAQDGASVVVVARRTSRLMIARASSGIPDELDVDHNRTRVAFNAVEVRRRAAPCESPVLPTCAC